mgnify:CR=1 FL=1
MSDSIGQEKTSELDGAVLREQGRGAREERARSRTLRGRLAGSYETIPGWLRVVSAGVAGVLLVVVLAVAVDVLAASGRIHPGIRIGEVGVGAMTPAQAAERVAERYASRIADPVVVLFEDERWQLEAADVSPSLNADALVSEAMEVGRTGSLRERISVRARLWFEPVSVPVVVAVDEDALAVFLGGVAGDIDREPVDAAVVIEGTEARLEPSVLGRTTRVDEVRGGILEAFASEDREVPVAVEFTPVAVVDADAEQALADARAMLSGPVTVTDEERSWEFSAADIAPWIAFRAVPRPAPATPSASTDETAHDEGATSAAQNGSGGPGEEAGEPDRGRMMLEAYVSSEEASATILAKVGEAGRPAVDARFEVGSGNVTIIPSQDGVGIDVEALSVEMTRVLTTEETRTVTLRTQRIEPELTTTDAEQMGVKERIAIYTTTFSASDSARTHNVHTLARVLGGILLAPGEVFSLNVVAASVPAGGYQEASVIVDGRYEKALGGGICQVATTMFNVVFESGLPVVERRNHSLYISSYPKGRDAAIAAGGPDLKFKNDTDHWILVATAFTNTSVTVSLYGTDPGYTVRGQTGEFTDIKRFTTKEVPDDTLEEGTRVVKDAGVNGRKISVKRTVLKGGTVVREDTFTSTYRPKQEIVHVGTKPVRSSTATETVSVR